ncbi:hypothetical protein EJ04DRAFT_527838 [Polyplosphaeria fusca]|uniref:Uncharacterized protein n=1 Tax=Polyplosphaeria fusca TaxID=682080 RepID=A0A9P4UXU1_9PLEO|nr:hypothetical protein EJ04DRAFT_527838 [Polyplosphaeria fusca]
MQRLAPQGVPLLSSAHPISRFLPRTGPLQGTPQQNTVTASANKSKVVKRTNSTYWKRSSKLREISFRPRLQRYLEQQLCDSERDIINILARFGTINRLNTVERFNTDPDGVFADLTSRTMLKKFTARVRMQGAYYWAIARDRRTEPEIGADLLVVPPVLLEWVYDLADNVD